MRVVPTHPHGFGRRIEADQGGRRGVARLSVGVIWPDGRKQAVQGLAPCPLQRGCNHVLGPGARRSRSGKGKQVAVDEPVLLAALVGELGQNRWLKSADYRYARVRDED